MMRKLIFALLAFAAVSCGRSEAPRAPHVILIGLDAMGAYGVQRAVTPTFNYLIGTGAVSMNTHCVRPTSSSQNWMSMVSAATPEFHGVTDNDWKRDNMVIEPALKNKLGFFPTIFDHIRQQKPDAKVYMFYEWTGQGRMYDVSVADKAVTGLDSETTLRSAFDAFFADKPDFLFVSVNEPDHIGHKYGHESKEYLAMITRLDAVVGELVARLEKEGMTDNTVLIVTADHGGLGTSHGGDSRYELTTPMIFFGKGVTKGKVIGPTLSICDVGATVAGLLGVELPRECSGRLVVDAFTSKDNTDVYVPIPFQSPANGFFHEPIAITLTGDVEGAEIRYTLDGSEPGAQSTLYEGPFTLSASAVVKSVVCRQGQYGPVATGFIRVAGDERPRVSYKMWEGFTGVSLPDLRKLGRPTRTGSVYEFSLDELDVEQKDHFAVEFTTRLEIDAPGLYTFGVISDDGSRVVIDGKLVVDNDGSHSAGMKYGSVELAAGVHDLKVEYFDDYMGQRLELYYSSDAVPFQVVPFAKFK